MDLSRRGTSNSSNSTTPTAAPLLPLLRLRLRRERGKGERRTTITSSSRLLRHTSCSRIRIDAQPTFAQGSAGARQRAQRRAHPPGRRRRPSTASVEVGQ